MFVSDKVLHTINNSYSFNLVNLKTIIIDIAPPGLSPEELDHRMNELESLVSTYGWVTIVKRVQKKVTPDYRTFVGSWKLDEIISVGSELGAELLIIGNIMKPAQVWNVNEHLRHAKSKMKAWDRVDLILKIFALHAVSPESKLQIELAAIKHMGPRIFGMGMELSRQGGGGSGAMRGLWETNTEIMKRHLKEKERMLLEKLKTHERTRALHRENRKRKNLSTIWIVGYTNAGKSSLFNILTHKGVLAEDKLFATLWTSVGKFWVSDGENGGKELLLNDTIGFIRDLPPDLIAAFTSTLEDSALSDLILHVVDASDPWMIEKIKIVDETLDQIWAKQKKIYVFNKIDLLSTDQIQTVCEAMLNYDGVFLSTFTEKGIDDLKVRIQREIDA